MYNGPSGSHTDIEAPLSAPNDGEYQAPTEYAPFPEKDGSDSDEREYGAIEQRAFDIQIASPVDDVETLFHRTYLTAQFHAENKNHWEEETPYTNDGGSLYDLAVLDLFEEKLQCEDIDPSDLDISERRLKVLFLRQAREQDGKGFMKHLRGVEPDERVVWTEIGYDSLDDIPSYDTFQREFRKLQQEEEIRIDAFDAAVTRTVYAVYRAGIIPPDAVKEEYHFDAVEPPLSEKSVPRDAKKAELRSFVELLLDTTTDPLTFERDTDKTKHDIEAFLGALAASALFNCGLENMKDVCDWNYPRDGIPGGGWMHNYVTERLEHDIDLTNFDGNATALIDEQFNAVHNRTLSLAHLLGFWSESDPLNLGVDMFRIDWTGDSLDATVGRPPKADNEAVTEQWTFVIASGVETERRFVLGGRWLAKISDYPDALDEILSNSTDIVDLDTILIDSESVGGDLIDTTRSFVNEDWAIRAPENAMIKGLLRLTPSNHIGFARGVKWNTDPKPNVIIYPYKEDDPTAIEINPDDVLRKAIKNEGKDEDGEDDEEEDEKISVPLANNAIESTRRQSTFGDPETIPQLTDEFADLETQSGIGNEKTHVAYLTDRSLPGHSAEVTRSQYIQRWSIESTVHEITNHFMPQINSEDPNQRLFGVHIAILFYNWHTLINRCLSPRGLRLDITYQQLLQAIRDIGFSTSSNDDDDA